MGDSDQMVLQAVLQVLVQVLVPILTAAGIGLVAQGIAYLKSKMSAEQLATVEKMVSSFAIAAEQYDLGGVVKRSGAEKKAWVLERVSNELLKRGIKIDVWMLSDMIETAVMTEVAKAKWNDPDLDLLTIGPGESAAKG